MSEQYFRSHPQSASRPTTLSATIRNQNLELITDHGVFSRKGVDFGSALLAEVAIIPQAARVLDLGCGYGVMGIAVAKSVGDTHVWMVDINERAVALANANCELSGVADRVQVAVSDGVSALPADLAFDVILFNPPIRAGKAIMWKLYGEARDRLNKDGVLYVVIQKKQGAESSREFLSGIFAKVDVVARKSGYRVIRCANH